jgi:hypothetical protein
MRRATAIARSGHVTGPDESMKSCGTGIEEARRFEPHRLCRGRKAAPSDKNADDTLTDNRQRKRVNQ